MENTTLPWKALWHTIWGMIPAPATEERIIVALDDSINPKSGRKIFGCAIFMIMLQRAIKVRIHGHNVFWR
jgi:hypothetical protein